MITDEAVAEFVSLTASSADEARGYLEMAGGELQAAVNLFLEMGGGPGPASPAMEPSPPPRPSSAGQGQVVDSDVAAEVAAAAAAAGIDPATLQGLPDAHMADADAERGVRAPMPAYQDQIINPEVERRRMEEAMTADSAAMNRRMTFDRPVDVAGAGSGDDGASGGETEAGGQAINQLFAPPPYNELDPYYTVIEKASSEGKWVLVNIQQAEVFASHTLNRDVWSDDVIKDIIQGSFLFWQRDDKSAEGDQFCQYYQCGHQLPHICVIDPRTGRRVKAWDGRKWAESHAAAEYLFGFLDEFCMSRSPPAHSPAASPHLKPQAQDPVPAGNLEVTGLDAVMEPAEEVQETEAVAAMPEEPADSVEHVKVSFRLPSGQRITRRFRPTDLVEQMFHVVSATLETPPSRIDLSMTFPKRSIRHDVEGGLQSLVKDAQVAGNMILVSIHSA